MTGAAPVLEVKGLTKRFGSLVANDGISFDVASKEMHCLFGENGAGKSTLALCLSGFHKPDGGQILHRGRPVDFRSPADAIRLGIAAVHQHFNLVPPFSVFENIIVGTGKGIGIGRDRAARKIEGLCKTYGIGLDLDAEVGRLSVGEQQWVEILKALYLDASILILDEPTAVLTPQQSDRLFELLDELKKAGVALVLISHKLREVMQSDRVTVLRKAKVVATMRTMETAPAMLTTMMLGREIAVGERPAKSVRGATVLELEGICALGERGEAKLQDIHLSVRSGEIVGIAGVAGNGQRELFEVLMGVRPPSAGTVKLDGVPITGALPRRILDSGIGFIPDDRFRQGLIREFDIAENLILGWQRSKPYSGNLFISWKKARALAREKMKRFAVAAASERTLAAQLSGGNAQRVILARELTHASRVILANQPTRGLDVGASLQVYAELLDKRANGFAVLLASEELDDLLRVCDRIAVLFKGGIMGILDVQDAAIETLGLMMMGAQPGTKAHDQA